MLVTNGKKILLFPQNEEEMQKTAEMLRKKAKDIMGVAKAKFPIIDGPPYTYIENSNGFTFAELKTMCGFDVDIQFRAIGPETVQMPDTRMKDIKHTYSPEEKQVIADNLVNTMYDKEKLEAEAKAIAKDYKSRIDQMETQMSDLGLKHRQGYEMKTKECHVHFDFENNVKIYTDKETEEVYATEPMEPKDYQTKLEFGSDGTFEEPEAIEENSGEGSDGSDVF